MANVADVVVNAGEFQPGHQWTSGKFSLLFSNVGNLELRDTASDKLLWDTKTAGAGATKLAMQEDGNLVVYAPADKPLWASDTNANPGAALRIQEDGNLVIYSAAGKPLWSSATHPKAESRS